MNIARPEITGIKPQYGFPGTVVSLRGKNLGTKGEDILRVYIAGYDVTATMQWKSPTHIRAMVAYGDKDKDGKISIILLHNNKAEKFDAVVNFEFQSSGEVDPLMEYGVFIEDSINFATADVDQADSSYTDGDGSNILNLVDESQKIEPEILRKMFPGEDDNLYSPNFNPAMFLLEHYPGCGWNDLNMGKRSLKNLDYVNNSSTVSNIKQNLQVYATMLEFCKIEYASKEGTLALCRDRSFELEESLQKLQKRFSQIFDGFIKRSEQVEVNKLGLSVIDRFEDAFKLPELMAKNLRSKRYATIVQDYQKGMACLPLTRLSDSPLLLQLVDVIEEQRQKVIESLMGDLLRLRNDFVGQKRILWLLYELDKTNAPNVVRTNDPAQACLQNYSDWLVKEFHHCYRNMLRDVRESNDDDEVLLSSIKLKFIAELCQVFLPNIQNLSQLLKECLAFDKERVGEGWMVIENGDGERDTPYLSGSPENNFVEGSLRKPIESFISLVRKTVFPIREGDANKQQGDEDENGADWTMVEEEHTNRSSTLITSDVLKVNVTIRKTVTNVKSAINDDQLHLSIFHELETLSIDLRSLTLQSVLNESLNKIEKLGSFMFLHEPVSNQYWKVKSSDEYGTTTNLPEQCMNILRLAMDNLREIFRKVTSDGFEEIHLYDCKSILSFFRNVFAAIRNIIRTRRNQLSDYQKANIDEDYALKLLINLNDCQYIATVVFDEFLHLHEQLLKPLMRNSGGNYDEDLTRNILKQMKALEQELFVDIPDALFLQVCGSMQSCMFPEKISSSGTLFQWSSAHKPQSVSPYVDEVMLNFNKVRILVAHHCPYRLADVSRHLIDSIIAELTRLFQTFMTNKNAFNEFGLLQAHFDLRSIQFLFERQASPKAEAQLKALMTALPGISSSQGEELKKLAKIFNPNYTMLRGTFR